MRRITIEVGRGRALSALSERERADRAVDEQVEVDVYEQARLARIRAGDTLRELLGERADDVLNVLGLEDLL
jgi:hypothetical protein